MEAIRARGMGMAKRERKGGLKMEEFRGEEKIETAGQCKSARTRVEGYSENSAGKQTYIASCVAACNVSRGIRT